MRTSATSKAQITKRWRIRVARNGQLDRVPTTLMRRRVDALMRRGWSQTEIAAEIGISQQALSWACTKGRTVHRSTASSVDELFHEYCVRRQRDTRRWPSEPIHRAVVAKYGSLRKSGWRRDVARIREKGDVSTETAEKWADRLGMLPCELWPDWYVAGLEEAG